MKYIYILLLISYFSAYSQERKLKGKVVEQETQIPVPFAHVFIEDVMYGTVTNEIGDFNSGSHEIFLRFEFLNNSSKIINPRFF